MKQELITESSRFRKLAGIVITEDEAQDKLDDLSKAFQDGSVESYVNLLKQYQSDPKVLSVLKAGLTDGRLNDEKFKLTTGSYAVKSLKPTQNEIGAEESLKTILTDQYGSLNDFLAGNPKFPSPIITYNGKYIIDGHHRWSQVYAANPDAKISVLNITGKLPARDIIKTIHTAIAIDSGEAKTRDTNLKSGNLLTFNSDKIKEYVDDKLNDKAREVWKANGFNSDEAIAARIAGNINMMIKKSSPDSWAPERSSMPQPDESNSKNWDSKMEKGIVNYIDPKTSDVKNESITKKLDNMLKECIIKVK
jgi:hypothetical protein